MNTQQSSIPSLVRSHIKIGCTGTVISNVHCPFDRCEWFSGNGATREINGKLILHVKVCKKCLDEESRQGIIRQLGGRTRTESTVINMSNLKKEEHIASNTDINDILRDFIDISRDKKKLRKKLKNEKKCGDEAADDERKELLRKFCTATNRSNQFLNMDSRGSYENYTIKK